MWLCDPRCRNVLVCFYWMVQFGLHGLRLRRIEATSKAATGPACLFKVSLLPALAPLKNNTVADIGVYLREILFRACNEDEDGRMDDYIFRAYVAECRHVLEPTSCLEILNYSVHVASKREVVFVTG